METTIGSDLGRHQRSTGALLRCQQLVRDVLWCNVYSWMYGRHVDEFAPLFNQSLQGKVKYSLGEKKKEQGKIHYDDVLLRFFSDIFFPLSSSCSFSPLRFDIILILSCLCTRSSNSSNNYLALGRLLHFEEYCLEIECRLPLRPKSVVNPGFLSIHMLLLVHFHHDTHPTVRLDVVSTSQITPYRL